MKYKFNFSYEDLSIKGSSFLKGVVIYCDNNDFIEAIQEFKKQYPNGVIKGIVINEN